MKQLLQYVIVATVTGWSTAALAEHEYDFFSVSTEYQWVDGLDSLDQDNTFTGLGYSLEGSYDLNNNYLIVGGIRQMDFDEHLAFENEQRLTYVGLGYHSSLPRGFDLFGFLSYAEGKTRLDTGTELDSGVMAVFGLRTWWRDKWELQAEIQYLGVDDPLQRTESALSIGGEVRWHFSPRFSLGSGIQYGDQSISTSLNVRFSMDGLRIL